MTNLRRVCCLAAFSAVAVVIPAGIGGALITPTTGQPGAPAVTCDPNNPLTNMTPGGSANAGGSVFNTNGTAGTNYAGNPNTASLANSNSGVAISQYDVACLHFTTKP
jgi:hypothetical protein